VYLSDLLEDFDTGRKVVADLNLIIVWKDDFDKQFPQGHISYEILGVDDSAWLKEYVLSHVNKCLRDRRTGIEIPVLEVKQVVKDLKQKSAS